MTNNPTPTFDGPLAIGDKVLHFGTVCKVIGPIRTIAGGRCVDVEWEHPAGGKMSGPVNVANLVRVREG